MSEGSQAAIPASASATSAQQASTFKMRERFPADRFALSLSARPGLVPSNRTSGSASAQRGTVRATRAASTIASSVTNTAAVTNSRGRSVR
jgi:hypothetical protein